MKELQKIAKDTIKTGIGISVGAMAMGSMGANASALTPLAKGIGTINKLNVSKLVIKKVKKIY